MAQPPKVVYEYSNRLTQGDEMSWIYKRDEDATTFVNWEHLIHEEILYIPDRSIFTLRIISANFSSFQRDQPHLFQEYFEFYVNSEIVDPKDYLHLIFHFFLLPITEHYHDGTYSSYIFMKLDSDFPNVRETNIVERSDHQIGGAHKNVNEDIFTESRNVTHSEGYILEESAWNIPLGLLKLYNLEVVRGEATLSLSLKTIDLSNISDPASDQDMESQAELRIGFNFSLLFEMLLILVVLRLFKSIDEK
jgi:hypothetical protein